jgi:hypothetical protein
MHLGMAVLLSLVLSLTALASAIPVAAQEATYNTAFLTDEQLERTDTLSVDQIRAFLASHSSYYARPIPDVDDVTFDPPAVIAEAAARYRINPQVLLATMEKENNAVTRTQRPSNGVMSFLTGCVTPNTSREQITCAAERFRAYMDQQARRGTTVSGWQVGVPKVTQDGVWLAPATRAVAAQFTYTPFAGAQWGGNDHRWGGVYLFYQYWHEFGFAQTPPPAAEQPSEPPAAPQQEAQPAGPSEVQAPAPNRSNGAVPIAALEVVPAALAAQPINSARASHASELGEQDVALADVSVAGAQPEPRPAMTKVDAVPPAAPVRESALDLFVFSWLRPIGLMLLFVAALTYKRRLMAR